MSKIIEVPGMGKVEFPDEMSDKQIAQAIRRHIDSQPRNVTQDMSRTEKLLAGAGKAFYDTARGAGQAVGEWLNMTPTPQNMLNIATKGTIPKQSEALNLPTRADIDKVKAQDKNLMDTGWGFAGNLLGNAAIAAPASMIPGANTIAGGALLGAAQGAMQPVGTDDSRGTNMAVGGAMGAAIPAAITVGKTAKAALIDPFTKAGKERIAGKLLASQAANAESAAEKLAAAKGATPGFNPTVAQAADDAGLASLERTVRQLYPQGFDAVDKSQRGALVDALRSIAQSKEARAAAVAARDEAVKPLYGAAKAATAEGDPIIEALLKRPSMAAAKARAAQIAAERGEQFAMTGSREAQSAGSGLLDASGNPIMREVPGTPAKYGGGALHDLKMGLDDAIGNAGLGGMQGAERNAALGTKAEFMHWLESKIPAYGQAKDTFASMSKPINQMDIGQELANRFTPALADQGGLPFKSTAGAYAQALRNGDELAKGVTGMGGATLENIMEPAQMELLRGVAKDSATKAAAESAGRGVGSDTVQKLAMSNVANAAGVPNWLASVGRVPGGWAKRAADVLYGDADEAVRQNLASLLADPHAAAQAMRGATMSPSQARMAELLRASLQSGSIAIPASANALEQ